MYHSKVRYSRKMVKTKVLVVNPKKPEKKKILLVAETIKKGGLVIFPTDTVYGLGANAFLPGAIKRIYRIKGRNFKKPLIFLLDEVKKINPLVVELSKEAEKLIRKYWPGPLSLIFKASPMGAILTGGLKTIGLRIPADRIAFSLIGTSGVPLATTSANLSGKKSPTTGGETLKDFKNKVEIILNAGRTKYQQESTILDVSTYPFRLIREGYIKRAELNSLLVR